MLPAADERGRMGRLLCERGFITEEDLQAAPQVQRRTGQKLGEILVEKGLITRLMLASALSEQWGPARGAGTTNGRTKPEAAPAADAPPPHLAAVPNGDGPRPQQPEPQVEAATAAPQPSPVSQPLSSDDPVQIVKRRYAL